MHHSHPIRQRLVAQILLLSLFLQSCLNSPIPPVAPKHTSRASTTPLSTNKKVKDDTKLDLSNTTSTSNEAIKDRSDLAALPLLAPPTNASYLTDKGAQKSETDLSREFSIQVTATHKDAQPTNNDEEPYASLVHDDNHPIAHFVEQQPVYSDPSKKLKKAYSNKLNHHTPYKELATNQRLASTHREVDKSEKEEKYEKESPSQISPKKMDTSSPIKYAVSSELIAQISRQVFTAKGGHLVAFEWEDGKCMAWVEEPLSVGFTRKHALPVYLLPGMTWKKVATMSELAQKYDMQVFLEKDKSCVLIGKTGLKGGGKTPLHDAIWEENLEKIKELIARGVDLEEKDKYGNTPLQCAIHYKDNKDNKDIVALLINAKANLEVRDEYGNTPLHYAIHYKDNKDIVALLINAKANLEATDKYGYTPLHRAIYKNNKDIVELLIQAGANLEATDKNVHTPLQYMIYYKNNKNYYKNNTEIVELLTKAGANLEIKDKDENTLLHVLIDKGNLEITKILLESDIDLEAKNKKGNTPLHLAVEKDHTDTVRALILKGINLNLQNKNNDTPLHLAVEKGHIEIIKLLIAAGADLNLKNGNNKTLLHLAIEEGHLQIVKELLETNTSLHFQEDNKDTLLCLAIECEQLDIVKYLIAPGADVNKKNDEGQTPLHLLFVPSQRYLIKSLFPLFGFADTNTQNVTSETPIHTKISVKRGEIFNYLISLGADINAKDNSGNTPLHIALFWNSEEILKHLISLGADVHAKNNLGNTPLHIAINKLRKWEVINHLVDSGADIHAKNNLGNTPLHMAVLEDNIEELKKFQSNIFNGLCSVFLEFLDEETTKEIKDRFSDEAILRRIWEEKVDLVHRLAKSLDVDKNIRNNLEKSPIDIASENNNKELSEQLLNALESNIANSDEKGNTLLHRAILEGNIALVKSLVASGADLHSANQTGLTPIDIASTSGHLEYVSQIFSVQGANINAVSNEGSYHLHQAAKRGDVKLLQALIQLDADVNAKNQKQKTALHIAARKGHSEITTTLLKEKTATNEQDRDGCTPLHLAAKQGHSAIVKELIAAKVNTAIQDKNRQLPIHLAAKEGHSDVAIALVQAGANLHATDSNDLTPVELAGQAGQFNLLKQVFQSGVDIDALNEEGMTHLHRAVKREDAKLLKKLIELGANLNVPDQTGNTPLQHAIRYKNKDILEMLVKAGANLEVKDKDENTPLHLAINTGNVEIAKILLESGVNLEARDKKGNTPLHRAAAIGNIEFIQALLASGADAHAKNQDGLSPLEAASKLGKSEVVEAIVRSIDINSRDEDGFSHVYKAWLHGYLTLAKQLIDADADINSTTEEDWTDLHLAAKHGHVEVVKQLLTLGANLLAKDKRGNIPLHIALQYKQQAVVELLIQQAFDPQATQEQTEAFFKEAFEAHHADLVTNVIKSGSYVDGRDKKWMTHFHHAIQQGNVQVAMRLKELGADIHAKNKHGENALHIAMRTGNIELAKWLMEQGVSYQIRDYTGYTPFYTALKHNQLGLVEQLIKDGMNMDALDNEGCTALHQAIQEGDVDMVQRLIALGANVHVTDQHGMSPLQMAVQRDQKQLVTLLVQVSFNTDKKTQSLPPERVKKRINKHVNAVYQLMTSGISSFSKDTQEPNRAAIVRFHEAVKNNDKSLIKRLLEAGLSINCRNQHDENALHIAVQAQHWDLALWLIQQGIHTSIRDNSGMSPLYHILKQGNMKFAKQLLEAGVGLDDAIWNQSSPGFTTLHEAVKKGDIAVVNRLLELGASVVTKEREPQIMPPLHLAALYGHVAVAQALSQRGADWNQQDKEGLTALQVASTYNRIEFIKQALETVVKVNQPNDKGFTHLHQAVLLGDVVLAKALLQAGADIHIKDPAGKTAFHHAAQQGNLRIIEALIDQGAKIDEPDKQGWTPLHEAVNHGHLAIAKRLLELGSDLKTKTQDGKQMLHLAAQQGHASIVKWLLGQGCDIHAVDLHGQTSLHVAAAQGHLSTVQELLHYGASVHLQDQQGRTPLHLSAQYGHLEVSITLVKKGASITAMDHHAHSPMFVAIQQGHFDLVYQSSYVYTYQQNAQHALQLGASKERRSLQQTSRSKENLSLQQTPSSKLKMSKSTGSRSDQHPTVSLQTFLRDYPSTLLPGQVEPFTQHIAPLLEKYLPTADVPLQERIIDYLQQGGQLYPGVLANYPVSDWIKESLLLDIGREALVQGDESLFQQLQEQVQVLAKNFPTADIEKLLLAIQKRQLIEPLQIDKILEVLHFASVVPMQLALKMLSIADFNWQLSWKSTWLQQQLPRIGLKNSQRNRLQHVLLHLPWSPAITLQFLEGIQGEQAIASIDDFLSFVTKYEIPEWMLIMAMHQPRSYPTLNQLQVWKLYIACELLKNKLVSVFPGHVKPLYDKLSFLLRHGCKYESIEELLTHLQAARQASSNNNLATQQAQHLLEAADLLSEYRPAVSVCERVWELLKAEKDLSSKNQSIDHAIHQIVVNAIFLNEHERSIEEINDYIAAKAPGAHFVGDVKALDKSYQEVEDAYHRSSKLINSWDPIKDWSRKQVTKWAKKTRGFLGMLTVSQAERVAVVKRAVELQYKYAPRDTQIMSLLSFLNHEDKRGHLLQINTGEGKSLIVAMLAAILALQGKKVDVVTSSTELSIPEVAKQQDFFAMFGLTVGENSEYKAKKEAYKKNIVYGTTGDFQGDILRTEFAGDDIRGNRSFDVVIVDEVDNLLFDNRSYSVMLSSPTPGMHHLEPVLAAAWSYVCILACHLIEKDGKTYFITENFKVEGKQIKLLSNTPLKDCMFEIKDREAFLQEKTEEHLHKLLRNLSYEERREREDLQAIQERITILGQEISNLQQKTCKQVKDAAREKNNKKKLKKIARKEKAKREKEQLCERLQKDMAQTAWKKNERDEIIEIPNHLKDFALHQIPYWAKNAIAALWHQKEVHYDVKDGKIVPIDYANTGVLQTNMVWDEGFSQMLQIKEGLHLEPENLSNNFISTIGYFKRYGSSIYGLTGTLGNQHTHRFFKELYDVNMAVIPPYKTRPIYGNEGSAYICKELPAIIAPTEQEWIEAIVQTTLHKAKNGRAILVLCQFIEQVNQLQKLLQSQYNNQKIFTYTGQSTFDKHDIDSGEIILATNIAGRGTDFKTSSWVEHNGGMHVCMTFLPTNYRVELQNAGRTAREGKKGTAQLILYEPEKDHSIEYLRARRDAREAKEIKAAMDDVAEMLFRDQLFTKFCGLEEEFFPSASEQTKIEQSQNLAIAWKGYVKEMLPPERIAIAYEDKIAKDMLAKLLEWKVNPSIKLSETVFNSWEEQAKKELPEVEFRKQCEQNILVGFCHALKGHVSSDVLASFQERKSYTPTHASHAVTYGWGKYERQALEERWGFWFHQILHQRHSLTKPRIFEKFDEFAIQIRSDVKAGCLVKNPYFYILKGNEFLRRKSYYSAVKTYNQAITLDPLFSVNARYNKVRALLKEKKNKKHHEKVQEELERALVLIANTHKPTVLGIHGMTGIGDPKPGLAAHLQNQINILSSQENHIMAALGVVKRARSKGWEINKIKKTDVRDLKEVFQDDPVSHKHAIKKAKTNGLAHLFNITEKKPTPWWSICAVALIGLVQIAAGVLVTALTGALGAQLGAKLINDGISDLVTAAKAAWSGKFSWAEWGLQKAISWTVAVLTIGFSRVCETFKKVAENLGLLNQGYSQGGVGLAMKQVGLELGKTVAKECINGLVDYGLSKFALDDIEKAITERVSEKITKALENSSFVRQALELDNQQGNNYWQNLLIKAGTEILIQEEHKWITYFMGVWKGVTSSNITGAAAFFELADASKAIYDLCCYTENFIKDWCKQLERNYQDQLNEKLEEQRKLKTVVQKHEELQQKQHTHTSVRTTAPRPEVKSGVQVGRVEEMEGDYASLQAEAQELDQVYTAPSNPRIINREFTKIIGSKLSNDMRSKIVKPVTSAYVNLTVDRVTREASRNLKESMDEHYKEGHIYELSDQAAATEKEVKDNEVEKYGPKETEEEKEFIDAVIEEELESIKKGEEGDIVMAGSIAASHDGPVHIYKNGKLHKIIGRGRKGESMHLQHVKNAKGGGHWINPKNPDATQSSGPANCMYDAAFDQMSPEQRAKLGVKNGEDLRKHAVQNMQKQPAITRELLKTRLELRWRNADVLMLGGSAMSKTADGLLAAQKWLDDHPSARLILNNLGTAAGVAMWVKNFTPVGLLMTVVGIAVNAAFEKGMELFSDDITAAQEKFSAYLLSIDSDLNKEQADILSSTAIKFMKEAGRMGIQWGASKGMNAMMKGWEGKGPQVSEKGPKVEGNAAKVEHTTLKPLGLGSTGRTEPKNLVEQMAMKGAMKNPQLGKVISEMEPISDPRWLGWTKMRYKIETGNGGKVVIHYVGKWEDGILKAVDDFKFK